ncbi:hypothetical protein AGMMS50276_21940 [Synergistales bacterium]|nr:hypothetical protein AGMMS50276_21940 [Synergistales bacterium]
MFAIKAIYDGNCFKLAQPVPVVEEYEVIIAFTEPIKKTQTDILLIAAIVISNNGALASN